MEKFTLTIFAVCPFSSQLRKIHILKLKLERPFNWKIDPNHPAIDLDVPIRYSHMSPALLSRILNRCLLRHFRPEQLAHALSRKIVIHLDTYEKFNVLNKKKKRIDIEKRNLFVFLDFFKTTHSIVVSTNT